MVKNIFCAGIFLLSLSSCNQNQQPKDEAKTDSPKPAEQKIDIKLSQLATEKDLVCGMTVEEGAIADTASFNGSIYAFCASECKEEFLKEPEKYLSQK